MQSLKGRVAASEESASTAEDRARETLDKISELRALVRGLSWTVDGDWAHVVGMVDAELLRVWEVITVAQGDSQGRISEASCGAGDVFPVEGFSDAPGPPIESTRLIKLRYFHCLTFSFAKT